MTEPGYSRRAFVRSSVVSVAVAGLAVGSQARADEPTSEKKPEPDLSLPKRKIFKAVKWGMVNVPGSVLDKFKVQKALGYDGVEMNSPIHSRATFDQEEVLAASRETGMPIHGVVDSWHWVRRLSSPDPKMRALGLEGLIRAIKDSHFYGGHTVLLVPGKVTGEDETHEDVWNRSVVEIRKVLPLAAQLGVQILIENVWNGFCMKPELMRDYIDAIDSPWVGSYYDIGNHQKYGPAEDWIRVLGKRIVKLDAKDWGTKFDGAGFGCKLGDGDVNWAEIRKAIDEIGYTGWATAELSGGDADYLKDVSARMDKCFGLEA